MRSKNIRKNNKIIRFFPSRNYYRKKNEQRIFILKE